MYSSFRSRSSAKVGSMRVEKPTPSGSAPACPTKSPYPAAGPTADGTVPRRALVADSTGRAARGSACPNHAPPPSLAKYAGGAGKAPKGSACGAAHADCCCCCCSWGAKSPEARPRGEAPKALRAASEGVTGKEPSADADSVSAESSRPSLPLPFFLFFRLRFSWSKWQCWQFQPFRQRPFGWKQHRSHVPSKWFADPMDGNFENQAPNSSFPAAGMRTLVPGRPKPAIALAA
mmetsp:Transcript_24312/g.63498  ORF Transcript_24312/g.63498 Transcript_24312/m.63498 type:complete len:233 (-) Transcript_24312:257-955(-)